MRKKGGNTLKGRECLKEEAATLLQTTFGCGDLHDANNKHFSNIFQKITLTSTPIGR